MSPRLTQQQNLVVHLRDGFIVIFYGHGDGSITWQPGSQNHGHVTRENQRNRANFLSGPKLSGAILGGPEIDGAQGRRPKTQGWTMRPLKTAVAKSASNDLRKV